MPLPAPRLARLALLIEQWQNLAPDAQDAWLAALPAGDDDLRPHLAALAQEAGSTTAHTHDTLWQQLPAHAQAALAQSLASGHEPVAGQRVGPWRLIAPLGRGGMGQVWRAARDDGAFTREVALKLPHSGPGREALVARFAQERDILAALVHPHIARLYDAGVDAQGQPFLALELVQGQTITAHADAHQLGLRERVALMQQVLQAVQHAHQQLIVHRDLKPSNILVGSDGQAHLLDFGIARLLGDAAPPSAGSSPPTGVGTAALTPSYAAPEQLSGQAPGTAADLYALGVVLYELLTGTSPYRPQGPGREALKAAILQGHPRAPSVSLDEAAAMLRGGRLVRLARQMAGDLDAIVLKALARQPADRYASADAMAQDLQRWLQGAPVAARPLGRTQRLLRLVRQHRVASAALALAFLSLAAGLGASLQQAHRAQLQQQRAQREADKAQAVQAFLVGLFDAADPAHAQGRPVSASDLMQKAEKDLGHQLSDQPQTRAAVMRALVEIYNKLEDTQHAAQLAKARVELLQATAPADDLDLADARAQWVVSLSARLECDQALQVAALAVPVLAAHADVPAAREQRIDAMRSQANCLGKLNRHAEAVAIERSLLPLVQAHYGATDWETFFEQSDLAVHLAALGQQAEVLALADQLAPHLASPPPKVAVEAAGVQGNLAHALESVGQWQRARTLYTGLALRFDALQGHTTTAALLQQHLGQVHAALGDARQADQAFEDARHRLAQALPDKPAQQAMPLALRVAQVLMLQGPAEALALAQQAQALATTGAGATPELVQRVHRELALALMHQQQPEAARQLLVQNLAAASGPAADNTDKAATLQRLASAQLALGDATAALASAQAAEQAWRQTPPQASALLAAQSSRLMQALALAARHQGAQALALADDVAKAQASMWPVDHPGLLITALVKAQALEAAGQVDAAQSLARSTRQELKAQTGITLPARLIWVP